MISCVCSAQLDTATNVNKFGDGENGLVYLCGTDTSVNVRWYRQDLKDDDVWGYEMAYSDQSIINESDDFLAQVSGVGTFKVVYRGVTDSVLSIDTLTIIVLPSETCGPTKTDDISKFTVRSIYPNPAYNSVSIDLGSIVTSEINIVDISGAVIKQALTMEQQIIQMDIQDLVSGLYFFTTQEGAVIGKVIKH